jgi:predicted 3-demethylubiquinone-9 3-methyltransferase (glyoxalase superfamily)
MPTKPKVRACLWFEDRGEDAAISCVSLLPNSAIESTTRPSPDGPALVVEFTLAGTPCMALNGGPHHVLSLAASIVVTAEDQAETDRLWDALVADGGRESRCGWLVDRFGVSWQIDPRALRVLKGDEDRAAAGRVQQAMRPRTKIDVAALETAFAGR